MGSRRRRAEENDKSVNLNCFDDFILQESLSEKKAILKKREDHQVEAKNLNNLNTSPCNAENILIWETLSDESYDEKAQLFNFDNRDDLQNHSNNMEVVMKPCPRPYRLGFEIGWVREWFWMNKGRLVDPGEAEKVVLVPGSFSSKDTFQEIHEHWMKWYNQFKALHARNIDDGLVAHDLNSDLNQFLSSRRLYERLLCEQLLVQNMDQYLKRNEEQAETWDIIPDISFCPPMCQKNLMHAHMPPHLSQHMTIPHRGIGLKAHMLNNHPKQMELKVAIPALVLHDHIHFCQEDRLFVLTRQIYQKLYMCIKKSYATYARRRFEASISAINKVINRFNIKLDKTNMESRNKLIGQITTLYEETIATIESFILAVEEKSCLVRALLNTWADLEECRENAGFLCTPARLTVKNISFEQGYSEISLEDQVDELASIKDFLVELKNITSDHIQDSGQNKSRNDIDELANIKSLVKRAMKDEYARYSENKAFRLSADGMVTADEEVPLNEQMRRKHVRSMYLYCSLYVNGIWVAKTEVQRIDWPKYTASYDYAALLRLVNFPSSIQIRIFQKKAFWFDQELGSVWIPISGSEIGSETRSMQSLIPSASWYQFSCEIESTPKTSSYKKIRSSGEVMVQLEWFSQNYDVELSQGLVSLRRSRKAFIPEPPLQQQFIDVASTLWNLSARRRLTYCPLIGGAIAHRNRHVQIGSEIFGMRDYEESNSAVPVLDGHQVGLSFLQHEDRCTLEPSDITQARWHISVRHMLLILRSKQPHLFCVGPIPPNEKMCQENEALLSILASAKEAPLSEAETFYVGLHVSDDVKNERLGVDKKRLAKFIQDFGRRDAFDVKLQKDILLCNIVNEPPPIPLRLLDWINVLTAVFPKRKRGLRPVLYQKTPEVSKIHSCRLLVQVVSARNVPLRIPHTNNLARFGLRNACMSLNSVQSGHQSGGAQQGFGGTGSDNELCMDDEEKCSEEVNSFVEVEFQRQIQATEPYGGCMPMWQHTMEFPFCPPGNDFSPQVLAKVNDTIRVSLYDYVEIDEKLKGGYLEGENTVQTQKVYLGSVDLPFQTVYCNGRVEGLIPLHTPPSFMSYHMPHADSAGLSPNRNQCRTEDFNSNSMTKEPIDSAHPDGLTNERCIYIKLLVMLDPFLVSRDVQYFNELNPSFKRNIEGREAYAKQWKQKLAQYHRKRGKTNRQIEVFVSTFKRQQVLVTRFITPQKPPEGLDTPKKLAHFVKLVPFLKDWKLTSIRAIIDRNDELWFTSQEFMDIIAGDEKEHAILLNNYLLWLYQNGDRSSNEMEFSNGNVLRQFEVYLVLGFGLPEGSTSYVLVKKTDNFGDTISAVLWNACTGKSYESWDDKCPLREIGCVINGENIWANVQESAAPWEINWDFRQASYWRPFFHPQQDSDSTTILNTIQIPLIYTPTDVTFVYKAEDLLREAIKRNMRTWRAKYNFTSFNVDVSHRLAEVLPLLEQQQRGEIPFGQVKTAALENVMRQRVVTGCPINCKFTSISDMVMRVYESKIHLNKHPEVQFALAVQCFPYCNNILSVWMYVVSMTRRL